jgi:hypothetical protein
MSEAKHTPGPWKIHRGKHNSCYLAVIDSIPDQDGKVVANCICHVAMTNDDRTANANAIAALPDLLAACEACIAADELTSSDGMGGDDMLAAYDAAIAAAKAAVAKAKELSK